MNILEYDDILSFGLFNMQVLLICYPHPLFSLCGPPSGLYIHNDRLVIFPVTHSLMPLTNRRQSRIFSHGNTTL